MFSYLFNDLFLYGPAAFRRTCESECICWSTKINRWTCAITLKYCNVSLLYKHTSTTECVRLDYRLYKASKRLLLIYHVHSKSCGGEIFFSQNYWPFNLRSVFANFKFKLKKKMFEIFLTWDRMGLEISNATPPTVMILFQPNFSECFLWQFSQKLPTGILKFETSI